MESEKSKLNAAKAEYKKAISTIGYIAYSEDDMIIGGCYEQSDPKRLNDIFWFVTYKYKNKGCVESELKKKKVVLAMSRITLFPRSVSKGLLVSNGMRLFRIVEEN